MTLGADYRAVADTSRAPQGAREREQKLARTQKLTRTLRRRGEDMEAVSGQRVHPLIWDDRGKGLCDPCR